ncbi:N-acetylneuraminate epimerase [Andreprevotia sp. IGB-42]|nr:N-acetylneuraminate epimerase [Andreprevotia sp. IGB-42]
MLLAMGLSSAAIPTDNLLTGRARHSGTTLADGRVLFAGGTTSSGDFSSSTNTAEIFDGTSETFAPTGSLAQARASHAAVRLADGRVLVIGGRSTTSPYKGLATAEVYNPATGSWSLAGTMNTARSEPVAVLLPTGKVLVIGGDSAVKSTELFDPETGTFSDAGTLPQGLTQFTAVALANGRVLLAGGSPGGATVGLGLTTALLWDPQQNGWSNTGTMLQARRQAAALVLADGKVLIAGGCATASECVASTEIYDPLTGTFALAASTNNAGSGSLISLADGSILMVRVSQPLEQYTPASGKWRIAGDWLNAHGYGAVVPLADGKTVLMAGGGSTSNGATAELFDPSCASLPSPVSPLTLNFDGNGGEGVLNINVPAGCRWTYQRLPSWITAPVRVGTDSGPFRFTVAPLAAGQTSTALRINETNVTISQTATTSTATVLTPASQAFSANGGTGIVSIQTGSSTAWSTSNAPSWVQILSGGGTGNGQVRYTLAANTGPLRTGSMLIAGKTFSVTQSSSTPECDTPTLSASGASFASGSGSGNVTLTTGAACTWSISNVPSWLTITAGATGMGGSSIKYAVTANSGAARSATLTIAGKSHTVSQSASTAYNCQGGKITPQSHTMSNAATGSEFVLSVPGTCSWSISSLPSWVKITSASSGQGSTTVRYTLTANTGPSRNTAINIGPASFNLTQLGGYTPGNCTAAPIAFNQTVSGNLVAGDCTAGERGSAYFTDRHTFNAAPGDLVGITLKASFDAYLYLKDQSGAVIAFSDNDAASPAFTNAHIPSDTTWLTLPTGSNGPYVIEATSSRPGETGSYNLIFNQPPQ